MPGPVVGGARAQVPAIDVTADDHDLVGFICAGELGDRVVDLDLAGAERVFQVDLDLDRSALEQPPDQAIRLGRQKRLRQLRRREVTRRAGHVDQAMLLVRIAENARGSLLDQELLEDRAELAHSCVVAHPPPHLPVHVGPGLLGRGLDRDLGQDDPGPLQLPLVRAQLIGRLRLHVNDRAALRALGRGAPAGRLHQEPLLDRHDHASLGVATRPGPFDCPRLEVSVRQAILL